MKALVSILFTLLLISGLINAGLISGYVKIGKPDKLAETAYLDSQRDRLTALIGDVD